jgi:hypothetical protein
MTQAPWASGPGEILQHGISLLQRDTDVNRRLAMLSIDNAVELMIKTYLGLPRRVTGIGLSRAEYNEISENFPALLDAIDRHASDKLDGINLGEIEWYHRLRNELYHQGNGLTVEREKVEVYAELAKLLFKNLFGVGIVVREQGTELLGRFMEAWVRLEQAAGKLVAKKGNSSRSTLPMRDLIYQLTSLGFIDQVTAKEVEHLRMVRNEVVHGRTDSKTLIRPEMAERLEAIVGQLEGWEATNPEPT